MTLMILITLGWYLYTICTVTTRIEDIQGTLGLWNTLCVSKKWLGYFSLIYDSIIGQKFDPISYVKEDIINVKEDIIKIP